MTGFVAMLMNATGNFKEPVTVESLLGKNEKKNKKSNTKEDIEALARRCGGK